MHRVKLPNRNDFRKTTRMELSADGRLQKWTRPRVKRVAREKTSTFPGESITSPFYRKHGTLRDGMSSQFSQKNFPTPGMTPKGRQVTDEVDELSGLFVFQTKRHGNSSLTLPSLMQKIS